MKITTLIDNTVYDNHLSAEHGLSLHIETDSHKILFDTGQSDQFLFNAKKLGIDISSIDIVVISHAHYDHIGGLIPFLKKNNKAKVYLKEEIFEYLYSSVRGNDVRYIGYPSELIHYSDRFIFLKEPVTSLSNLHIIRDITLQHPLPKGNAILFRQKENETAEPDKFEHELILAIENKEGNVLFSGCAHTGILNMVESFQSFFPNKNIQAIFGGLHLIEQNEFVQTETTEEIENIAYTLLKQHKKLKVFTGHCTGKSAFKILETILGDCLSAYYTGHKVVL